MAALVAPPPPGRRCRCYFSRAPAGKIIRMNIAKPVGDRYFAMYVVDLAVLLHTFRLKTSNRISRIKVTALIVAYGIFLAVINYPIVVGMDWYVHHHPVRLVFDVTEPPDQRAREIKNSWITTPIHAVLYVAFIGSGVLRVAPETTGLALGTFVLTFLWTEIWHYVSHVAMHANALHFIHREHHLSRRTEPWTSVSFSLLEKFIFSFGILGGLALISFLHPLSALGVFLYYVLYFYTNTLGHSGFEIRQPDYYRRFMGKVFNTPSYHALHHARYIKNYGLITPWFDRLFSTEWADVAEVQTRAATGKPLTRLRETCAADSPA